MDAVLPFSVSEVDKDVILKQPPSLFRVCNYTRTILPFVKGIIHIFFFLIVCNSNTVLSQYQFTDTIEFIEPAANDTIVYLVQYNIATCESTCDALFYMECLTSNGLIATIYETNDGMLAEPFTSNYMSPFICSGLYEMYIMHDSTAYSFWYTLDISDFVVTPPQLNIQFNQMSCSDDCDGELHIIPQNVDEITAYQWTDLSGNIISQDSTAINLCHGEYIYEVTDTIGCQYSDTSQLQPAS